MRRGDFAAIFIQLARSLGSTLDSADTHRADAVVPPTGSTAHRSKHRPGGVELRGAAIVLAFAAFFYLAWYTDTSGHGERAFLLLPVVFLTPFGLGALLYGLAARFGWPGQRWFATLPFVLTAAAVGYVAYWLGLF